MEKKDLTYSEKTITAFLNSHSKELLEQCDLDYEFISEEETFLADEVEVALSSVELDDYEISATDGVGVQIVGSCHIAAEVEAMVFECVDWRYQYGGYNHTGITKHVDEHTAFCIMVVDDYWQLL